MPARAFIDSDLYAVLLDGRLSSSKCPRGHLLILIYERGCQPVPEAGSKCPRGHLLILMDGIWIYRWSGKGRLNAREGIY